MKILSSEHARIEGRISLATKTLLTALVFCLGGNLIAGPSLVLADTQRIQSLALRSIMRGRPDLRTNAFVFSSLRFSVPASRRGSFLVTYMDPAGEIESSYLPQTEPPLATIDSAQIGRIAMNAIRTNQPHLEPDDLVPHDVLYEHAAGHEDYISAGYTRKSAKPIITSSTNLTVTTTATIRVQMSNSGAVQGVSSGEEIEYGSHDLPLVEIKPP